MRAFFFCNIILTRWPVQPDFKQNNLFDTTPELVIYPAVCMRVRVFGAPHHITSHILGCPVAGINVYALLAYTRYYIYIYIDYPSILLSHSICVTCHIPKNGDASKFVVMVAAPGRPSHQHTVHTAHIPFKSNNNNNDSSRSSISITRSQQPLSHGDMCVYYTLYSRYGIYIYTRYATYCVCLCGTLDWSTHTAALWSIQ